MSVDSGTTGEGGDIQVFDDPHDVSDAVSKRTRDYAIWYYQKVFFNRTETPNRARRIVCGQRVHAWDVSATCIKSADPVYVHLNLPEQFDPKHPCTTPYFTEPRRREGELLRPARFSQEIVEQTQKTLGTATYRAIHQQDPVDAEGAMFKRCWFDGRFLPAMPAEILNWVRCWDSACTEASAENPDPDFTAGCLAGGSERYPFVIADVRQKRMEAPEAGRYILAAAQHDLVKVGRKVQTYFEAVAGFKGVFQQYAAGPMRGWPFRATFIKKNENKVARAMCLQACAEAKNVWLVEAPWNEPFLEQLCTFAPGDTEENEYSEFSTVHDDMVDAATQCYDKIYGGGLTALVGASPMAATGQAGMTGGLTPMQRLGRVIHGSGR
jgi:predicted phage terminase large subunit-like protein